MDHSPGVVDEAVKRRLVPRVGRETIRCYSSTTTSSLGGKKMGSVPELDEQYITKMEDVLETYEQPYDPKEPVACVDEKPITLHADGRPGSPAEPGGRQGSIANTNGVARPMF